MEIEVKVNSKVSLEKAHDIAKSVASNFGEAMPLSYYDRERNVKVPDVDCCGENSWEIYAKTRGGNLKIKVNEYEFMFRLD
jgi:hypothetical protein